MWEKPTQGRVKCNTDGVSRGNPGSSAYNLCLRDDRGVLVHAQAEAMSIKSNMQAEIIAILKAIIYCNKHTIRGVIIKTNFLVVMKIVKKEWRIP